jgi:hypothetical protein
MYISWLYIVLLNPPGQTFISSIDLQHCGQSNYTLEISTIKSEANVREIERVSKDRGGKLLKLAALDYSSGEFNK